MTSSQAIIREIRPDDSQHLARFLEENNQPEIVRHFHPFPLTVKTAHQIACTTHLDRFYIATMGDSIVGLCMLRGWDEGYDVPSFGVFVDHRYQRRGLGRQMTEFAIEEARRLGCPSVRLSVYASNSRALQLYSALGFVEVSREETLVAEEPELRIVMTKTLNA